MVKENYSVMRTAILTMFPKIFTDIDFSNDIFHQALQIANSYNFSFQPELFVAPMAVEIEARYKAVNKALGKLKTKNSLVIELAAGLSPRCLQFDNLFYVECDLKPVVELKKQIFKNLNFQNKTKNFYSVNLADPKQLKNFLLYIPEVNKYKKIILISEGLFWYMKKDEIETMSKIFLQTFGKKMVWISADCPVKHVPDSQQGGEYRTTISNSANSKRDTFESAENFVEFFEKLGYSVSSCPLSSLVQVEDLMSGKIFSLTKDDVQKRIDSYTNVAIISPTH